MSTIETPSAPPYRKPSRWRRFFVGSALVLAGVIVGVGTTALSQGYGRGWSDDGPGRHDRFDGPRGFFRDHDGPRGGHGRWFGRDRDGDGGWRHGPGFGGFGGPFLTPGRIERMVDRLGWAVDASSEQKQKIAAIVQRAADDLRPLREKHLEGRRAMREVLAAATIDRGKLEALRTEQMKLADEASRRIAAAVTEAAEILTPEQRADLARRLERFGGRRG
jgi:periplasmic protein CpxP/Spy